MVTASLTNLNRYLNIHPAFKTVEAFLKSYSFSNPGERIYINGDKLFAIPSLETGKPKSSALLEAHNRYIDIQVCLEGNEIMGWMNRSDCKIPRSSFDNEKDIIFFDDAPVSYFHVSAGSFAIFFPEDCHAPLIGEGIIRKIIFKVEVNP